MSRRASTHESDPDDIDIDDLYNLKGSSNTGPGGSDSSHPSAPTAIALIVWGLAAILARLVHTVESPVDVDVSRSSHDNVGFYIDVVLATTGVEFLLAIIGAPPGSFPATRGPSPRSSTTSTARAPRFSTSGSRPSTPQSTPIRKN